MCNPQAQPYCIITVCFSDSPPLMVGQEHHPCTQRTVPHNMSRQERKESSVTRQADLSTVKQIMAAQDVCSENHCGVGSDEWVVFMASGSFPGERLKLEDDFNNHGRLSLTELKYHLLPLCLHEEWWQDRVLTCRMFSIKMRKIIVLVHFSSLKWKSAQAEENFFIILEVLLIQRKEPQNARLSNGG